MRKAVVRSSDGFVENVIEWKIGTNWPIPDGHTLIDAADGSPGDTWDGEKFISPPEPEPEPDYKEQYEAATNQEQKNAIFAKMLKLEE